MSKGARLKSQRHLKSKPQYLDLAMGEQGRRSDGVMVKRVVPIRRRHNNTIMSRYGHTAFKVEPKKSLDQLIKEEKHD